MAIITVSRGPMTGGRDFAEQLADSLGYACLSHEVVAQAAEKIGIPEEKLAEKIEKSAGVWERLTTDRRLYLVAVQSALADACVSGDLVYHGRAGHMLLKGLPAVLRVRLIAPMSVRIRAVMDRRGFDYDAARDYIRSVDQERVRWTRFVYGVDWRDPANYDVVLNMAGMGMDSACAMVAAAAERPPYRSDETVRGTLKNFALASRVKLALGENTESRAISFEVTADDGSVEVLGAVAGGGLLMKQAGSSEEKVRRIAEAVKGVKKVSVEFRRFADSDDI